MRWGNGEYLFARPIHWILALFGEDILDFTLFGVKSGNITYGHRFLVPNSIVINNPSEYEHKLEAIGKVIIDFNKRKQLIIDEIKLKQQPESNAVIEENLLEEVTAMTEYPVAFRANFSKDFLRLPKECLISAMAHHQKSFALIDKTNQLLPSFILISNMPIDNTTNIIQGNERVIDARLQDAAFLYDQDLKIALSSRLDKLKIITLHEQLGSVYDQTLRIQNIARAIAELLNANIEQQDNIKKAALLCKADLVSQMVLEFPELQGIMGYYYALAQQEKNNVAVAIKEHYLPRFSEDILPNSIEGICLALAYRLDLLVGLFAIGKAPTGEKDPFALRRHSLAIIRILIEQKLSLELVDLFIITIKFYNKFDNIKEDLSKNLLKFCLERLKNWYLNRNINNKIFTSVLEKSSSNLYDFNLRINAVVAFNNLGGSDSLISAHKRVNNLLNKIDYALINQTIKLDLLTAKEELDLFEQLNQLQPTVELLLSQKNYNLVLENLIKLKPAIDLFFEKVMVMVEDQAIKHNRLILLDQLRKYLVQ
jgi:glycyl-tRNA synthetase beta chain